DGQAVGLVHRDISPQNIRVSTSGQVKVMDFGIAKARSSSNKTQTGAVKGKLSYMSPEQIMAQDLDGRSDIFALGIVLYELLTGQRPFGHESELLAISAIMNQQPRSVSDLSPGTPAELEQIVLRCLAKDRNQRFQSCSELQMALEQYLRAEGVLLTARDVSEYLRDFFSAQPVGTIAALERSNYGTAPGLDSGVPGSTGKLASGPTRVNHAGGMNTMTQGRVDDGFSAPPPRTRNGLVAVLAVLVVAVLGAGGALFWFVILPAMNATANSADATAEASGMLDDAAILANADVVPDVTADADSSSAANEDVPPLSDALVLPLEGTGALATAGSGSQEGSSGALAGTAALPSDGSTNALEGTAALPTEGTTPVAEPPDAGTESRTPARDAGSRQSRPPSREVTSTGSLTLVLSSSARVYIDGRERGYYSGSVRIADLPVGRRTIRGVNAEGIERIVEVDIVPGLNRARLNF
ncbi:MAG: serine/threonine protein kinase, partial [Myxococcales bacterium]|nr:serine/threonine protein kinase [Myxococcales bacterium]